MRLSKAWLVAIRDFKVFKHQKTMLYAVVIFPVLISIIPSVVLHFAINRNPPLPAVGIPPILEAFSMFLIIGCAFGPLGIAAYTIVGEKIEKSLEPLLASPLTDGEILLGKTISAVLPTLIAMYTGAVFFIVGTDIVTYPVLNYYYFPNWTIAVIVLLGMPAATMMSVEFGVIVSSRVNDVRSSTNFGALMFFPFLIIYIAGQLKIITLDTDSLLIISVILFGIDIVLFFISKAMFQREEILTKWK